MGWPGVTLPRLQPTRGTRTPIAELTTPTGVWGASLAPQQGPLRGGVPAANAFLHILSATETQTVGF